MMIARAQRPAIQRSSCVAPCGAPVLGRRCSPRLASAAATPPTTSKADLPQISVQELADALRSGTPKVLVVDVREPQEREAGWIRGSINIPSATFLGGDVAKLDDAITGPIAEAAADVAVVHCHLCQSRGPKSSRALAARMAELGVPAPRVVFLTGGVATFLSRFSTDEELAVVPPGGWDPNPKQ